MFTSVKAKAIALGSSIAALGLLASTSITHAVDTPIDAAAVTTLGTSLLTTMQNAVQPFLGPAIIVIASVIGLLWIIRFARRHVK